MRERGTGGRGKNKKPLRNIVRQDFCLLQFVPSNRDRTTLMTLVIIAENGVNENRANWYDCTTKENKTESWLRKNGLEVVADVYLVSSVML